MCVDISFQKIKLGDRIEDYLPDLERDTDSDLLEQDNAHIQAHARPLARIVYKNETQVPQLTLMRWGLLREYMFKNPIAFKKYAFNTFNARSENILDKASTWYSIKENRCLIDTPGIYEHRKIKGWKNKVPYFVSLANGKRLLIPGLYYHLHLDADSLKTILQQGDKYMQEAIAKTINTETGEVKGSFTMLTRKANPLMQQIHNDGTNKHRMPLFLQPEQAIAWLNPNLSESEMAAICNYEIPSEALHAHPVYTLRTANPRPDHLDKDAVFDWPGLPELGHDDPGTLF